MHISIHWGRENNHARHTVKVRGADEGDVDTQVTMVGRAVQAKVDTKGNRRPRRIFRAAIKADLWRIRSGHVDWCGQAGRGNTHLVCGLQLEFLKDLLRLRLCGTHDDR